MSHVLNVLYPGTKKENCLLRRLRFACLRTQVLPLRISCLTLSLRWLALTRVLLTPHPYKGLLPKHERKGLERGSNVSKVFQKGMHADLDLSCSQSLKSQIT